ncbi:uncharacterized protein LOC121776899 [Salvia splendens]|uniref:uncharacterized protein LOC121776899 n=1 Tax=Salvia splendens TaxID=180675 RepID=UPI001C2748C2|nr:uncharacterized protein LOC121776899 [Salvia splendens]
MYHPLRLRGLLLNQSCSELPKKLNHKSDPNHSFSLLSEPPEHSLYYSCDACGDLIRAFGFQCDKCDHRMHVKCALLPESVECKAHEHALQLHYTATKPNVDGSAKEKEEEEEEEEEELPVELQLAKARIEMENQRVRLEFQMQMARQNAQFMNSIANSWRSAF